MTFFSKLFGSKASSSSGPSQAVNNSQPDITIDALVFLLDNSPAAKAVLSGLSSQGTLTWEVVHSLCSATGIEIAKKQDQYSSPTQDIFIHNFNDLHANISNYAVSIDYQITGSGNDRTQYPVAVNLGFNTGSDFFVLYTVSCCGAKAYSAVRFVLSDDGDPSLTCYPGQSVQDKMLVSPSGQKVPAGNIFKQVKINIIDEDDPQFKHRIETALQMPCVCPPLGDAFSKAYSDPGNP